MVLIIRERATLEQVELMLQTLRVDIKVAVDIERGILAGGGEKHAFCEAALARWRLTFDSIWSDGSERRNMSEQASAWSERILDMSRLLSESIA